jgi:hypothetical protein
MAKTPQDVFIFHNGMACVLDEYGEQIPELQGEFNEELFNKLLQATNNNTLWTFPGLSEPKFSISKDLKEFEEVARRYLAREKTIEPGAVKKLASWLGEEGVRYFRHLKGLTGTVSPVLRLNVKRKKIPVHPVHFREGMEIRNYLRSLEECSTWTHADLENRWREIVEEAIK